MCGVLCYRYAALVELSPSREEAEKLPVELGVSVQGSVDELRKKLNDKWRALEAYLPPHVTDKLAPSMDVAGTSCVKILGATSILRLAILRINCGVM